jgi:hypothetical protein
MEIKEGTKTVEGISVNILKSPIFGIPGGLVSQALLESVNRLSKAKPEDVQEIVASQIQLMTAYHNVVLEQARRSFLWALIAAGIGLGFFLASVTFLLVLHSANVSIITLISGSLIEVISAINFFLYGKTSSQLANFQSRLDVTQRFLLANSICEGLDDKHKHRSRAELVRIIAGIANTTPKSSPEEEEEKENSNQ